MSPDFFVHLPNLIHVLALVSCRGNQPGDELELLVCHGVHILSSLVFKRRSPLDNNNYESGVGRESRGYGGRRRFTRAYGRILKVTFGIRWEF